MKENSYFWEINSTTFGEPYGIWGGNGGSCLKFDRKIKFQLVLAKMKFGSAWFCLKASKRWNKKNKLETSFIYC